MLRQRVLTAIVLIGLVGYAVLALGSAYLGVVLALFAAGGAWEWARLIGWTAAAGAAYVALVIGALWTLWWMQPADGALYAAAVAGAAWWPVALVWILRHEWGARPGAAAATCKALAGVLVLVPCWAALVALHAGSARGAYLLLFLLALVWIADSAAYFAGSRWGRAKLAPQVSPGKTRVGVYGALTAVAIYGALGAYALELPRETWAAFVAVCLATAVVSVIGDLFESLLKRHHGVKDSGTLVPGHGGVLDRIDSLTAAAPVFLLGTRWLQL